jgi:CRP-like cAMP-binding protein
MKQAEIVDTLSQLSLVRRLSPPDLADEVVAILAAHSELRRVPQGGVWLRENEPTENKGFILMQGAVAVKKSDAPEVRVEAPELLGEAMQFNPRHLRTATVTAVEDIVVARFRWDDFWAAVEERLTPPDQEKVREAVKALAWDHIAG